MKNKNDVLIGLFFVTLNSKGKKEFQGQILSKLEDNIYLVQLYEWVAGYASTMRLFSLDRLLNANLYKTEKEWNGR